MQILTWSIDTESCPKEYPVADVRNQCAVAFKGLNRDVGSRFYFMPGDTIPNIRISFAHNRNYPIKIARCYRADNGIMKIEFDPRVRWGITWFQRWFNSQEHFITLLLHEVGHSVGLDHTQDIDSIMYHAPTIRNRLSREDRQLFTSLP